MRTRCFLPQEFAPDQAQMEESFCRDSAWSCGQGLRTHRSNENNPASSPGPSLGLSEGLRNVPESSQTGREGQASLFGAGDAKLGV